MYKTGLVQITLELTLLITFFLHTILKLFHELVKWKLSSDTCMAFVIFRLCCVMLNFHQEKSWNISVRVGELAFLFPFSAQI